MLQFEDPGRIYLRTGEAEYMERHRELVENWIREFERQRRQSTAAMPVGRIRVYSVLILIFGIVTLILQKQIALTSVRRSFLPGVLHTGISFVPSFIGAGVWAGLFSLPAGAMGLAAAQKRSTAILLDFTVMCSIVNLLAAIVVILNSIGLEIHSRMCSFNLEQDPESWGKYCGETSVGLQAALLVVGILLFFTTALGSLSACRALHQYSVFRTPPLVVYYQPKPSDEEVTFSEAKQQERREPSPETGKRREQPSGSDDVRSSGEYETYQRGDIRSSTGSDANLQYQSL